MEVLYAPDETPNVGPHQGGADHVCHERECRCGKRHDEQGEAGDKCDEHRQVVRHGRGRVKLTRFHNPQNELLHSSS